MRPVFALLLSLAIFGAVGGYLRFVRQVRTELAKREPASDIETASQDRFSLEITLTFDAGGESAFSLEPTQATAVLVRFRGDDLLRVEEPVAAGTPLRVEDIAGVVHGANEFYVEANPTSQGLPIAHAVRVRVFRNGSPVADETLWSEPGLPVRGTVRIDVEQVEARHDHP